MTGGPSTKASEKDGSARKSWPKDIEARLAKAGWTVDEREDEDVDGWPSLFMKLQKGGDDDARAAKVWIDAFGEPLEGQPKPRVDVGKGALLRFAWQPSAPAQEGPDLAGFSRDVLAVAAPDKATDRLFNTDGFDRALAKWGMAISPGSGGGRARGDVIFNHRRANAKDGGALAIEVVHFPKALEKGTARLLGTTLVAVQADRPATATAILAALGG